MAVQEEAAREDGGCGCGGVGIWMDRCAGEGEGVRVEERPTGVEGPGKVGHFFDRHMLNVLAHVREVLWVNAETARREERCSE